MSRSAPGQRPSQSRSPRRAVSAHRHSRRQSSEARVRLLRRSYLLKVVLIRAMRSSWVDEPVRLDAGER